MPFKLRSSNATNIPLTWTDMDNNLSYLLTNMSGSNISLLGPSSVTGSLSISGSSTVLTLTGTASLQHVTPAGNGIYSLGASGAQWSNVYATTFNGALNGTATTASNITPAIISDAVDGVMISNGNGTLSAESSFTFDGTTVSMNAVNFQQGDGANAAATSHAEGYYTTANGSFSHAEGYNTTANSTYSHAEGDTTTAGGYASHAEGTGSQANATYSHAEGTQTTTNGLASHAEGYNTITTTTGQYSHAEGNLTTASNSYSHAEGYNTTANGLASHAEGNLTTAYGDYSHAEGASTVSSGSYSHAEGSATNAKGIASHAEGISTIALGTGSHAEGLSTQATGNYSHTDGYYTIATASGSYAGGAYASSSHAYEWSRSNTSLGQYGTITLSGTTAVSATTELSIGGTSVDYFTIPTNTAYYVDLTIMGWRTTSPGPTYASKVWNGKTVIYNLGGTVYVEPSGAPFNMSVITGSSGGTINVGVTSDRLVMGVTGSGLGSNIRWFAKADYIKISF